MGENVSANSRPRRLLFALRKKDKKKYLWNSFKLPAPSNRKRKHRMSLNKINKKNL
jgi:hypothetical protein